MTIKNIEVPQAIRTDSNFIYFKFRNKKKDYQFSYNTYLSKIEEKKGENSQQFQSDNTQHLQNKFIGKEKLEAPNDQVQLSDRKHNKTEDRKQNWKKIFAPKNKSTNKESVIKEKWNKFKAFLGCGNSRSSERNVQEQYELELNRGKTHR